MISRKKTVRGFTLIEVLIAMTLLSIMVVLLFGSLNICAESWNKGERKVDEINQVAVVYNFFQRHLTVAKPLWDDFSVPEQRSLAFEGNSELIQFVGEFPASAGRKGLQQFKVSFQQDNRLKPTESGSQIKVFTKPFYPTSSDGVQLQGEEVTLIKNVKKLSFSYFGFNGLSEENSWQTEWLQKESLPDLVKVDIELENGNYWPQMIFELKVKNDLQGLESGIENTDETADPESEEVPEEEVEVEE